MRTLEEEIADYRVSIDHWRAKAAKRPGSAAGQADRDCDLAVVRHFEARLAELEASRCDT